MNTKMYVGNIPFSTTEVAIRELFSQYGEVTEVYMPQDRESGRPRGFAFVSMDSPASMTAAINALNGQSWEGRNLTVNEARPREDNPRPRFSGGGGRGGRDRGDRGGYGGERRERY